MPGTGRFMNLDGRGAPSFGAVLKWKLGFGPREAPPLTNPRAHDPAARVKPDLARIHRPDPGRIQLTWIGHATWLIQAGGVTLLTDPMFSGDCSPFPVPRIPRATAPGMKITDLPPIDAVILSHSHYDHLDVASLSALTGVQECAVPLGVADIVRPCLSAAVTEAEWGDRLDGISAGGEPFALTCLPAHHASARSAWDRDKTLWCGWLIEVGGRRIYFTGDTARADFFGELGKWMGVVDVALIPIGAYSPRWFMRAVHCDPAEAVGIHRAVGARRSLAMHWGVFPLADEPLGEPPLLLAAAVADAGLAPGEFTAPVVGETVIV